MVHTCNPSVQEAEAYKFKASLIDSVRICLNNNTSNNNNNNKNPKNVQGK